MSDQSTQERPQGEKTEAAALVEAIESVSMEHICRCSKPFREHEYWEDRICDYNGYRCPGLGGEYRYDAVITSQRHRDAQVAVAQQRLSSLVADLASALKGVLELEEGAEEKAKELYTRVVTLSHGVSTDRNDRRGGQE